jgi:hypothetical protein
LREQRETYSHTTQLTQMYHQLDSYHLGTNRAMFFMLPRPHVVQSELTFVNGPRLLEGIQEVFLIVMRPKDQEVSEPIYTYKTSTPTRRVLRRASVGHDLGNRVERPSAGHRTPTRGKARRADLHRAEQRPIASTIRGRSNYGKTNAPNPFAGPLSELGALKSVRN